MKILVSPSTGPRSPLQLAVLDDGVFERIVEFLRNADEWIKTPDRFERPETHEELQEEFLELKRILHAEGFPKTESYHRFFGEELDAIVAFVRETEKDSLVDAAEIVTDCNPCTLALLDDICEGKKYVGRDTMTIKELGWTFEMVFEKDFTIAGSRTDPLSGIPVRFFGDPIV